MRNRRRQRDPRSADRTGDCPDFRAAKMGLSPSAPLAAHATEGRRDSRAAKTGRPLSVLPAAFLLTLCLWPVSLRADVVVGFDDSHLALPPESYWNGSQRYYVDDPGNEDGEFLSGGLALNNHFSVNPKSGWEYWDGWAYSDLTDTITRGFANQYSAITGSGVDGSANYGMAYCDLYGVRVPEIAGIPAGRLLGAHFTNATFPYWSMAEGDSFCKKFGGSTGSDPDWFLLEITGRRADGAPAGTVEFYLADFRPADGLQDYIVDEWTWVDLAGLDSPSTLEFRLSSSDEDPIWGMNTPAYFAMDNLILDTYSLTSVAPRDWGDPDTWDDGERIPDEGCDATVAGHAVTVASDGTAASLLLVEQGILEIGPHATLAVDANVAIEDAEYVSGLDGPDAGMLAAGGDVALGADAILALVAEGELPEVGYAARTVLTAAGPSGITGSFADGPSDGEHLAFGVFVQELDYVTTAEVVTDLDVILFQAIEGDADGDRDVDFADFNALANHYTGTDGTGQTWLDGDFDGDGDVDFADFNALANHYTGQDVEYDYVTLPMGRNVPEPTTMALILSGLLACLFRRRRRNRIG